MRQNELHSHFNIKYEYKMPDFFFIYSETCKNKNQFLHTRIEIESNALLRK